MIDPVKELRGLFKGVARIGDIIHTQNSYRGEELKKMSARMDNYLAVLNKRHAILWEAVGPVLECVVEGREPGPKRWQRLIGAFNDRSTMPHPVDD